jgi:hypothetical protein
MRARRKGVVAAQPGEAAFATTTASLTSSAPASGTMPLCSPVAGLNTGAVRPLRPATGLPLIQCLISVGIGRPSGRYPLRAR